jgi:hypothetical protein
VRPAFCRFHSEAPSPIDTPLGAVVTGGERLGEQFVQRQGIASGL